MGTPTISSALLPPFTCLVEDIAGRGTGIDDAG
jgi:hypothetical protein